MPQKDSLRSSRNLQGRHELPRTVRFKNTPRRGQGRQEILNPDNGGNATPFSSSPGTTSRKSGRIRIINKRSLGLLLICVIDIAISVSLWSAPDILGMYGAESGKLIKNDPVAHNFLKLSYAIQLWNGLLMYISMWKWNGFKLKFPIRHFVLACCAIMVCNIISLFSISAYPESDRNRFTFFENCQHKFAEYGGLLFRMGIAGLAHYNLDSFEIEKSRFNEAEFV